MEILKCVVVGDSAVGKTSLLISYAQNKLSRDYVPMVFDNYAVTVNVGGKPYTLVLFDTAGQKDYDRVRSLSYLQTNIFLLCYSVVMPSSMENVEQKWIPDIARYAPGVPYILVGTQTDLRDGEFTNQKLSEARQQAVPTAQGQRLAEETKSLFVECSALTQSGIKNVDEAILAALDKQNGLTKKSKKPPCSLI